MEVTSSIDRPLAFMPVEEHALLRNAVVKLFSEARAGDWRQLWLRFVEMGGLAVALPAEQGGMDGAGAVRVVAEEIGRRAIVLPFACNVASSMRWLVRWSGLSELEGLVDGSKIATLALHEADTLPQLSTPQTRAWRNEDVFHLEGRKQAVPFGAEADYILTPAWIEGERQLGLFLVLKHAEGLHAETAIGIDAAGYADLTFANVEASLLCQGAAAQAAIDWLYDAYVAALCAEAVGAMRHLVGTTAGYLGIRQQFGMPLAVNQALRHRLVDIDLQLTQAETAADWAASALDNEADTEQRRRALLTASFTCIRAAWRVSQESVQMHDGMGMAAETGLGLYLRRLLAITLLLGDEDGAAEVFST